jgi:hypothetical protein
VPDSVPSEQITDKNVEVSIIIGKMQLCHMEEYRVVPYSWKECRVLPFSGGLIT